MLAIVSLLMVLILSVTITKVASVALIHTGLSREIARFQARSAFTGVGFTTAESEKIVKHPVRRRILMLLMILGNAGIVTAMSSLIVGMITVDRSQNLWLRVLLLVGGLVALWTLANSTWVDRHLSRWISGALRRWTDLDVRDYASLLQLTRDYAVAELAVDDHDWMCNHQLKQLNLAGEGVLVLGIVRAKGIFLGAPSGNTSIGAGDTVILYGRSETIENLDRRPPGLSGGFAHQDRVQAHKAVQAQEEAEDPSKSDTTVHRPQHEPNARAVGTGPVGGNARSEREESVCWQSCSIQDNFNRGELCQKMYPII